MPMRIRYERDESLPRLAWCAMLGKGSDELRVRHGPWVETRPAWFVEGVFDAPFDTPPDAAGVLAGTSGRVTDQGVVFAACTGPPSPLFVTRRGDTLFVSNSMVFLMVETGDEPDVRYPHYGSTFRRFSMEGVYREKRTLPTRDGRIEVHESINLHVGPDVQLRRVRKVAPPEPGSFADCVRLLDGTVERAFANARDPARAHVYEPLVALSRGYDSPCVAVFSARHGCREALTFVNAKSKIPDDGVEIGAQLGMHVHAVPWSGIQDRPGLPEAEFAACPPGAYMNYAAAEHLYAGRALVRGRHGERIFLITPLTADFIGIHRWSGSSLLEHRLRLGMVDLLPLVAGEPHRESFRRISNSEAMQPWSVGSEYDRPIPRRIVEQAGIARHAFGQVAAATGFESLDLASQLCDASRPDFDAFFQALEVPRWVGWGARARRLVYRLRRAWNRLGLRPTFARRPRIRMPIRDGYLFHWGVARTRHRYEKRDAASHG